MSDRKTVVTGLLIGVGSLAVVVGKRKEADRDPDERWTEVPVDG